MRSMILAAVLAAPWAAAQPSDSGKSQPADAMMAGLGPESLGVASDLKKAIDAVKKGGTREEVGRQFAALSEGKDKEHIQALMSSLAKMSRNLSAGAPDGGPPGQSGPVSGRDREPGAKPSNPLWDLRKEYDRKRARDNPRDPQAVADVGVDHYEDSDYKQAIVILGRAIKAGAMTPRVLTAYGNSAYHLGDYELGEQAGKAALELDPEDDSARALYKLSHNRQSRVHIPSALTGEPEPQPQAETAAAPDPGGPAPAAPLSVEDQRRRAELAVEAAKASVVPPDKVQMSAALTREAQAKLQVGDLEDARRLAAQAAELNPQNAQAWNYDATALTRLGRYPEAVEAASFAIGLSQGQAAPYLTRSLAYSNQALYQEAEKDAWTALERAPDSGEAYYGLAFALAGQRKNADVVRALSQAAQKNAYFAPMLEKAVQMSADDDMTLLFTGGPVRTAEDSAPAPARRQRRFLRLILLSLTGGVLVALGILHNVSAGWRERVHATMRRAFGGGGAEAAAVTESRPAQPSGGLWQQYDLVREIGSGGMGLVYEARDRSLDRRVAIKRMRDEIRADPQERRRFVQEARTVAALHHPNIVDIYAIVEHGEDVFLIFEYVGGKTLLERLRAGPLPFAEARRVLGGVGRAVSYAHRSHVVHRDLTPSNIMLTEDGTVKVMDFGVARVTKEALSKYSQAMTNTIVGTPPYMAPEQEQGTVRLESDVFAMGVLLFECLSGQLPFAGQGAGMLLNKINGRYEPITRAARQALPAGIDTVLAKALAPDPDLRYRTADEFLAALDTLSLPAGAGR